MRVNPVKWNSIEQAAGVKHSAGSGGAGATGRAFGETLKNAVAEVNDLQHAADQLAQKVSTGDVQDVHEAILAMQKASLAFQFTIQVRNKAIEAYQEIMRMQI